MSNRATSCATILLLAVSARSQTVHDTTPEANPARPTVSTPAELTPLGYIQFETGALGATSSPEFGTRIGINEVAKLTVLPRLELFALTEPYVHSSGEGLRKQIHPGEVFAGAQGVLVPANGAMPTIAVSYVRRLYESPAPELDLGTFRQSGTLLISSDVAGVHYDANFIVTEQTQGGVRRAQHGQTLSVSRRWGHFTLSGELWRFTQPFLNSNAVGNLWAISYSLRRNVVLDGGYNRGLTGTSTHWEEFVGSRICFPVEFGRSDPSRGNIIDFVLAGRDRGYRVNAKLDSAIRPAVDCASSSWPTHPRRRSCRALRLGGRSAYSAFVRMPGMSSSTSSALV